MSMGIVAKISLGGTSIKNLPLTTPNILLQIPVYLTISILQVSADLRVVAEVFKQASSLLLDILPKFDRTFYLINRTVKPLPLTKNFPKTCLFARNC